MKRFILNTVFLIASLLCSWGGVPFCTIRTYDERDGLSQHQVKQAVQDDNGIIWVATWNGLNRFDGAEFNRISPGINDEVRRHSSRFSDIRLDRTGWLWCRIDQGVIRFNVNDYTFYDSQARLEEKFGRGLNVVNVYITPDEEVVLVLDDGTGVIMDTGEVNPEERARIVSDPKDFKHKTNGNRKLPEVSGHDRKSLVILRRDDSGTVWLMTREGDVMCAPRPEGPFTLMGKIDAVSLRYCTTDSQGNVWLCSKSGLHRLTFGTDPYTVIEPESPSMLRTSFRDSEGRIWISWSDAGIVTVSSPDSGETQYLLPDGSMSAKPGKFGIPVYSIFESKPGEIWLGSKPYGIYRLMSRTDGSGYDVDHFTHSPDNPASPSGTAYYDGAVDRHGRLWLATMGRGIDIVEDTSAPVPEFVGLSASGNYPSGAMQVRRIRIINDSLGVAATTGGLLSFSIPESLDRDSVRFKLHVSEPGRPQSLGNVATMDIGVGNDGYLYVATESDGVVRSLSPFTESITSPWDFHSYHPQGALNPEVALSVEPFGSDSLMLVTGSNELYLLNPATGETKIYGSSFWHRDMHFSDARPLRVGGKEWLVGLDKGGVRVELDDAFTAADTLPLVFNAVSIVGRPDSLLAPGCGKIILDPTERNLTLRFTAICYADPSAICYAFKVGDDDSWTSLGKSRTVSFANLDPGVYEVTIRSTDTHGRWIANDTTIILDVRPTFWETGLAKALYLLALLLVVGGAVWTVVYIRRIKRQQRELLEAHLRRIEPSAVASEQKSPAGRRLSDEDRALLDGVTDFIEKHISDSSVTVDDIASAVAVSRSGLTRKLKSLIGVTPAEFLRETRLAKADSLLRDSGKSIKEIAAVCGFSDMNYFGKCFKSSRGVTPGAYRKENAIESGM